MSVRFISAMIEMMRRVHTFLISGTNVISLESRPLNFRVFIHAYSLRPQTYFQSSLTRTRTESIQKQLIEYDVKSKYPEKYSTVDKVGSEKTFSE